MFARLPKTKNFVKYRKKQESYIIFNIIYYIMKARGMNQAYMLLKLRKNYYIMSLYSFGSITGNILQL